MPEHVVGNVTHPAQRYVFVYGTLRRGDDNDITSLFPPPRYVGAGVVRGVMYHLGAYPGVVLADLGDAHALQGPGTVVGEVYAIEPELERVLDEIEELYPQEKDEYAKWEIAVFVGQEHLNCFVYEINPAYVNGKPIIASGDWVRDRRTSAGESV